MNKRYALPIFTAVIFLAASGAEAINTLDIDQEGYGQRAYIEQATVDPYDADGNLATIRQAGRGQHGIILQQSGSDNEAHIRQEGYGGTSSLDSLANCSVSGFGNCARIKQSASGGVATIVQEFREEGHSYNNNEAQIEQRSAGNNAHIVQVGNHSFARVDQEVGAGNTANISQGQKGNNSKKNFVPDEPCEHCIATILQSGAGNTATIEQRNPDRSNSGIYPHEAFITQQGDGNTATISQLGFNDYASILQNGMGNTATIDQYGDQNTATITQTGNYNTGNIAQTGDSNGFTLIQNGDGLSFSIVQDGGLVDSVTQTN